MASDVCKIAERTGEKYGTQISILVIKKPTTHKTAHMQYNMSVTLRVRSVVISHSCYRQLTLIICATHLTHEPPDSLSH